MSMSSHLLERGISFWKSDQQALAQKIFEAIIYNNRQDDTAWIWYIYSLNTDKEKIAAFETFLNIFPEHSIGKKALKNLKEGAVEQVARPVQVEVRAPKTDSPRQIKKLPAQEVRPGKLTESIAIPLLALILGMCFLLLATTMFISRYNSLQSRYNSLQEKYQALEVKEAQVSRNYDSLYREHQTLLSEYISLVEEYNGLVSQYNTLRNEYSILRGTYDSLYADHTQLIDKYNTLVGDYNILNDIAIKPPYIVVHDRIVDATFYDTDGQLVTWSTPFAGLEHDIEHGSFMRQLIVDGGWQTTLVYNSVKDPLFVRDFSTFVTPDTFQDVIPDIYQSSSSAYDFIYRLWYMIGQLSHYTSESEETPRYPLETLLAGGGDCEDLSILLASMIKAAPVDWYVDLVYVDSENINNPEAPDHVVVYINTGYETFIVETTSDQVMQPYTDGVTGWLVSSFDLSRESRYPVWLQ